MLFVVYLQTIRLQYDTIDDEKKHVIILKTDFSETKTV